MAERKRKAGVRTLRSAKELMKELKITKVQGALYNLFHHTRTEFLAKMVLSRAIWMSRIDQMNDGTEDFPNAKRTYAFCLSAVPTENAGMWIAYGLPRHDAIRVRFSGKALLDISQANGGRVDVLPVKDDKVQLKPVQGMVSLQYVGYASRFGSRVHVRNVIYQFPPEKSLKRQELMDECGSYIKLAGWQYEHEIRLVVTLDKAIDAERIQLDFSEPIRQMLEYTPKSKPGLPSVIVGPWGSRENFNASFRKILEDVDREHPLEKSFEREDVKFFLGNSSDENGLVRDSEFKDKIHLGVCKKCGQKKSCSCVYCEEA